MTNTTINWETDTLDVICAKQELEKFLNEQSELKGRCPKIDSYHEKRINELILEIESANMEKIKVYENVTN